jgi:hypothetical protein
MPRSWYLYVDLKNFQRASHFAYLSFVGVVRRSLSTGVGKSVLADILLGL